MVISKNSTRAIKVTDFEKNGLPSDFNIEVKGLMLIFFLKKVTKFNITRSKSLGCLLKLSTC
jgi:hypothetical protein